MKNFEVHRIKKTFGPNSSEALAQETQDLLNKKCNEGFELVSVSFHIHGNENGYIYSYCVFKR